MKKPGALSLFRGVFLPLFLVFLLSVHISALAFADEGSDPQEEIAALKARVEELERELENTRKKSQTWKNMYYSLKEQYDALTGSEESASPDQGQEKAEAVRDALAVLGAGGYSRSEVITQLVERGHSKENALFGADNCGANYARQAARRGSELLASASFSLEGLTGQLLLSGFTEEEAKEGAALAFEEAETSTDTEISFSLENVLQEAKSLLKGNVYYSYSGMVSRLKALGYTEEEAIYGADHCEADWKEQARRQASFFLLYRNMSHDELIKALLAQGFTDEEAEYGYSQNGL